jgi:hypothetical protein
MKFRYMIINYGCIFFENFLESRNNINGLGIKEALEKAVTFVKY